MISPAAAEDPGRGWIYAICNAGFGGEGVIAAIVREFRPGSERVLDSWNRGPYREAHGASERDPRAVSAAFCDEGASSCCAAATFALPLFENHHKKHNVKEDPHAQKQLQQAHFLVGHFGRALRQHIII